MTVHVSAHQAAQLYRELRELDATRRAARRQRTGRTAPPDDLSQETSVQTALLLVEPYVTAGGPMSRALAATVAGLLAGSTAAAALRSALDTLSAVPRQRGPHAV